ncbi:MAG: hypothetical protein ABI164_06330 [Acidobacteriaceae bacterium]
MMNCTIGGIPAGFAAATLSSRAEKNFLLRGFPFGTAMPGTAGFSLSDIHVSVITCRMVKSPIPFRP